MQSRLLQRLPRLFTFGRSASMVVGLSLLFIGASFVFIRGGEPRSAPRHSIWQQERMRMPADLSDAFSAIADDNLHKLLIELDRHPTLVNQSSPWGSSLLHLAAMRGNVSIVRALILRHARIDAQDDRGATPLDYAAFAGRTAVASVLIKNGANVNAASENGRTPIFYAAMGSGRIDDPTTQYVQVCDLLLKAGAHANVSDERGRSPVQIASEPVARLLLDRGAAMPASNQSFRR